jgi:hypothetical protein
MSATEDTKFQFRVLRRQFLFRVVDVEVLSTHALGDASKLLGQFVALLLFISLLLSLGLLGFNDASMTPDVRLALSASMEHFLVATTMLVVGIFAVLSWDSTFPDHRDVLVVAPLPVRARTMFLAKIAATATALTLVIIALNAATGLGWPLAFAMLAPSRHGFLGIVRCYGAYWFTLFVAGAFVYCGLLAMQGFAAQILPRRLFLRASGFLQMAAFCSFVSAYFLEPSVNGLNSLAAPEMQRLAHWVPTYWFLGLFDELAGFSHPVLMPLAKRAWLGIAITAVAAVVLYTLSYMRTMRQIVEEPDIKSSPRGFAWLPRFGNQTQTAIGQFAVRSLTRSRQHRLILAFYLGIGLAFTIVLVHLFLPVFFSASAHAVREGDSWREPSVPVLAASIMMIVLAAVGVRVAFAFPLELPANWIFRAVGVRPGPEILTATRRALMFLSVVPVWLISAAVSLKLWPQAVDHLIVLALLAIILADLVLWGFCKIPFTCSYLPGKSQAHMVFLAAIGLVVLVTQSVLFERRALEEPGTTIAMLALIVVVAAAIRWRVTIMARADRELKYDETDPSALLDLGLSRDGGVTGTGQPDEPPNLD